MRAGRARDAIRRGRDLGWPETASPWVLVLEIGRNGGCSPREADKALDRESIYR
jgi:hypothetical protein